MNDTRNAPAKHGTTLMTFDRIDRAHLGVGEGAVIGIGASFSSMRTFGLIECDDWDAADYRIPMNVAPHAVAVIVRQTGKAVIHSIMGATWVRCSITFVGDCEPDTTERGWMRTT